MRIDFYKRIPRETIPTTFFSIIRNRRRSVAMLSGIILSIALLSGIILYNVELKQDNYDTIVGDFPYEVRFDIMGNEILSEMRKLSDYISSDERVVDTTVIASIYSNVGDNWDEDDEIGLEAIIYPIYENGSVNIQDEDNDADIVFVDSDYFEGEIGKKLLEMDFKGETDLSGNSIIISEQYLNTFGLKIGDVIDSVNFT